MIDDAVTGSFLVLLHDIDVQCGDGGSFCCCLLLSVQQKCDYSTVLAVLRVLYYVGVCVTTLFICQPTSAGESQARSVCFC